MEFYTKTNLVLILSLIFTGMIFYSCKAEKAPALNTVQTAMTAESFVNFSLFKAADINLRINTEEDDGMILEAVLKYNETGDLNSLEAAKKRIKDGVYIKRLIILQDSLGEK